MVWPVYSAVSSEPDSSRQPLHLGEEEGFAVAADEPLAPPLADASILRPSPNQGLFDSPAAPSNSRVLEAPEEVARRPWQLRSLRMRATWGVAATVAVLMAMACVVVATCTLGLGGGAKHQHLQTQLQVTPLNVKEEEGGTACGQMLEDYDLWTGHELDRGESESAIVCSLTCEQDPRCGVWSYAMVDVEGSAAGTCRLKRIPSDSMAYPHGAPGIKSGMPCRNKQGSSHILIPGVEDPTASAVASASGLASTQQPFTTAQPLPTQASLPTEDVYPYDQASVEGQKASGNEYVTPCGHVENNIDLTTLQLIFKNENVESAQSCKGVCEKNTACSVWVWGKPTAEVGLRFGCYLKELGESEEPVRSVKDHVVSGKICRDASGTLLRSEIIVPTQLPGGAEIVPGPEGYTTRLVVDITTTVTTVTSTTTMAKDSLYCFALIQPTGYEPDLIKKVYQSRVGLFHCDGYAIYSNTALSLGPGLSTIVIEGLDLKADYGGEFHTALNNDIFLAVWRKVIVDKAFENYAWSIKVDADCVIFPSRIKKHLAGHVANAEGSNTGLYINNCQFGLHGPLEVLSRKAVEVWGTGMDRCVKHFNKVCNGFCGWGEDMFLDQCLWKVLGVKRDDDDELLVEDHCAPPPDWASCKDGAHAAFHPFKSVDSWVACYQGAGGALV